MKRLNRVSTILSLLLVAGCHDFNNPVDPEAQSYQGFASVRPTATPAAPALLAISLVPADPEHQAKLDWTDNASDEQGFHIERKTGAGAYSVIATVGPNVTTYTDTTLSGETAYTYQVQAYNVAGSSGYSNAAPWTTALTAPTNLIIQTFTANSITLQWNDNSALRTGYCVEHYWVEGGGLPYVEITQVNSAPFTQYFHGGLSAGTHYYRVRAHDATPAYSMYSNEISQTLPSSPPAAPSFLAISLVPADPEHQAKLDWTDNASDEQGFHIERKTGAGAYSVIATVGPNVTTYTDTTLSGETTYTYQVQAYNVAGSSAYSNAVPWTTALTAPTGLSIQTNTASSITIQWNDNSAQRTGYRIEHYHVEGGGPPFVEIAVVSSAPFTQYFHGGLPAGTHYYRVRAYDATPAYSLYSNEVSQTIP